MGIAGMKVLRKTNLILGLMVKEIWIVFFLTSRVIK